MAGLKRTQLFQNQFQALLGRDAAPEELAPLTTFLDHGGTFEHVQAALLASDEYYVSRAAASDHLFVATAYADTLGREPATLERSLALAALDDGLPPAAFAYGLASSLEGRIDRLSGYYQMLVHRPPDGAGRAYWATLLQGGMTAEEILPYVACTPEYVDLQMATPVRTVRGFELTARGSSFRAAPGQAFSGPVISFVDGAGLEPLENYSATIDWGDGTTTTGTIGGPSAVGPIECDASNVLGNHAYQRVGTYSIGGAKMTRTFILRRAGQSSQIYGSIL